MADEKLNTNPAENPQPSLFDTGPADNPAPETPTPEPPAPEGKDAPEQAAAEPPAPESPAPEVNPPEQAAGEPPEQDAPAGAPGEVSVSADQIEKLMAEKRAAVEKNEPPEPEQPPAPGPEEKPGKEAKAPKGKAAKEKAPAPEEKPKGRRGRKPKEEKAGPGSPGGTGARRGRPPKADKAAPGKPPSPPRDKMSQSKGQTAPAKEEAPAAPPPAPEQPAESRDATRAEKEEIVYLNLSELFPFKDHPFGVRDDAEMKGLILVDLDEARDELEETEYEKWRSDQEQMLDGLVDNVEEWINQRLDNIDGLISDVIARTNANASDIQSTLEQVGNSVGYTLTDAMESIWDTNNNIVAVYGDTFSSQLTSVNATLESIRNFVETMAAASNFEEARNAMENKDLRSPNQALSGFDLSSIDRTKLPGSAQHESDSSNVFTKGKPLQTSTMKPAVGSSKFSDPGSSKKTGSESFRNMTWGRWFLSKKDSTNKNSLNKNGSVIDRLKYFDFDSSIAARSEYYKAMGGTGTYTDSKSHNDWMLSEMKKNGFKHGGTIGKLIDKTGEDGFVLARTGEEIITKENLVLLNEALKNLNPQNFSLKDYDPDKTFGLSNIGTRVKEPEFKRNSGTNPNQIDNINITFNLPNVRNYDEFKTALIKDRQFEKSVQEMTLGNALGKNSYNKFRV